MKIDMGSMEFFKADSIEKKIGEKNEQLARIKRRITQRIKKMSLYDWRNQSINKEISQIMQEIEYIETITLQKHILLNK